MLAYGIPLISVDFVVVLCEINMEVLKKMDKQHPQKTPVFFFWDWFPSFHPTTWEWHLTTKGSQLVLAAAVNCGRLVGFPWTLEGCWVIFVP